MLAFVRTLDTQRMLVLFNLSVQQSKFELVEFKVNTVLDEHGLVAGYKDKQQANTIVLPGFSSFYALID